MVMGPLGAGEKKLGIHRKIQTRERDMERERERGRESNSKRMKERERERERLLSGSCNIQ